MASSSARRKSNNNKFNSSNFKSQQQHASMSSPSSSSFGPNFGKIALVISVTLIGFLLILFTFSSISGNALVTKVQPSSSNFYTVEVISEFPHDSAAFTQGLLYAENDTLYESTGLNGQSSVRKVALRSGKVQAIQKMNRSYFGEGLTLLGERLFQVTWLEKIGFIYDRSDLSKFEQFTHEMEDGWGLATDGKILFGSDGSSTLYQIDPLNLKVIRKHIVKYDGHELHNLNELEYINGEVWANVWQTDCIARISPKDGTVLAWVLLPKLRQGLLTAGADGIDVLNGIAWDKEGNRLFVTGKLWPKLYEIKLHPMKTPFNGDIKQMCMPAPVQFRRP